MRDLTARACDGVAILVEQGVEVAAAKVEEEFRILLEWSSRGLLERNHDSVIGPGPLTIVETLPGRVLFTTITPDKIFYLIKFNYDMLYGA